MQVQLTKITALILFICSVFGLLAYVLSSPVFADEVINIMSVPKSKNQPLVPERVEKKDISISTLTGLRLYKGKPYTGEVVLYYPSGKLAKVSNYVSGLRHGLLTQWFTNGKVSFSSEYSKGVIHGVTKSWWSNGHLRSQSTFLNGKLHGDTQQWYATGEIFKKMHYQHGKEVGLQQAWRRNGKLYSNYQYINGRIFGLKRANMCVELEDEKLVKSTKS